MYEITAESLVGVQQKIKPKVLDDEDLKPLREDEAQWPYLAPSAFNSCQILPPCLRRRSAILLNAQYSGVAIANQLVRGESGSYRRD